MADEVRIQHVFRDDVTGFCDAIVLPYEDYVAEFGEPGKQDEAKLEAAKAERVAGWQATLDAPQPEPDPKAEAQALADEKALLVERLAVVSAELAVKIEALPVKDRPVEVAVEAVAEGK